MVIGDWLVSRNPFILPFFLFVWFFETGFLCEALAVLGSIVHAGLKLSASQVLELIVPLQPGESFFALFCFLVCFKTQVLRENEKS